MARLFTKQRAIELAKRDRHYVARKTKSGNDWCVWDSRSDHYVEFDDEPTRPWGGDPAIIGGDEMNRLARLTKAQG